jgi:hypothetical protein
MGTVRQFFRAIAVLTLIVASLNASAGLCFCHRGPAVPGSSPASHGCCHGQNASGTLAIQAVGSCCHVEAAQRDVTQTDAVQIAPPRSEAAPVHESAGLRVSPLGATTVTAPSPPLHTLRL